MALTPQILTNQTVQEDLDFVMVFAARWYLVLVWRPAEDCGWGDLGCFGIRRSLGRVW